MNAGWKLLGAVWCSVQLLSAQGNADRGAG